MSVRVFICIGVAYIYVHTSGAVCICTGMYGNG